MCSVFYGDLILSLVYALVGSGRHSEHFQAGLTVLARPDTVGPIPCQARSQSWARRATRPGTDNYSGLALSCFNGSRPGQTACLDISSVNEYTARHTQSQYIYVVLIFKSNIYILNY
jgi:hypothetical protein